MSKVRKIKGVRHYAYESEDEFRKFHPKEPLVKNWKEAKEGQWCISDDNQIVQVLKKSFLNYRNKKQYFIRTIIGMVKINGNMKLQGSTKKNIYSFSSKYFYKRIVEGGMNGNRIRFAKFIAYGATPEEAYIKSYPDLKDKSTAANKAKVLLRNKRVRHSVDKEIEKLMSDVGITKRYLLENTKDVVDKKDTKDNDKLRAIETLMKISGMLSVDKKVDSVALIQEFTGFTKDKLQAFEAGILRETKKELLGDIEND